MTTLIDNKKKSNTGWLYYKHYYSRTILDKTAIQNINNKICNAEISIIPSVNSTQKFQAITTYPGLVIGTGYTHDQKKNTSEELSKEAFKIGFFFDYSSGMPVILGSSVKGLLRSAFPQRVVVPKKASADQIEKERWIKSILKNTCGIDIELNIDDIEKEIFDGLKSNLKPIPLYERDIFFDAVPLEITENNLENSKRLLGTDYITPHKNKEGRTELDPFSNPTPIKFLKIMPKVKFEFRFRLEDSHVIPALTAEKKMFLFQEIIKTIGIGAKTNVGYGQFEH